MSRSLATQAGEAMQEIVEKAVEHFRRKAFFEGLSRDFRILREDKAARQEDQEERALWDNMWQDGAKAE